MCDALNLKISPSHRSPASYKAVFQKFGRLHVPDFLEPNSAARLETVLRDFDNWTRVLTVDAPGAEVGPLEPATRTRENITQVERVVTPPGQNNIEFLFDIHSIVTVRPKPVERDDRLKAIGDFINGPDFIRFAREMTGDGRIQSCDAAATRYLEGHYLTPHNDANRGENRLYAYVLNLTRPWKMEWGGVLNFVDGDGHVAEGYTPVFNALNVFRVPQQHAVSMVNHLARQPRLSITGWMHGPFA